MVVEIGQDVNPDFIDDTTGNKMFAEDEVVAVGNKYGIYKGGRILTGDTETISTKDVRKLKANVMISEIGPGEIKMKTQ